MRENRTSGSEGGESVQSRLSYPYQTRRTQVRSVPCRSGLTPRCVEIGVEPRDRWIGG